MRLRGITAAFGLLFGLGSMLTRPAAAAEFTYDVRVRAFCHSAGCSNGSDDELRKRVLRRIRHMNKVWEVNGISFRPAGGDLSNFLVITYDNEYSKVTGKDDKKSNANDKTDEDRFNELRQAAEAEPDLITIYMLEDLESCFSDRPLNNVGTICGMWGSGKAWAHEIGHFFCLAHTHTFQDAADNDPLNMDGDAATDGSIPLTDPAVEDTPADPGLRECRDPADPNNGEDFDKKKCGSEGKAIDGHEWCDWMQVGTADTPSTDPGSFWPTYVTVQCKKHDDGSTANSSHAPLPENAMSYYDSSDASMGPYYLNGVFHSPFTKGQIDKVAWCRQNIDLRQGLVDTCNNKGGDSDSDGLCDTEDTCPLLANLQTQKDSDGDGLGDPCDLCPNDPTPETVDTDHDGAGDLCDKDDDNDDCLDEADQNPKDNQVFSHSVLHPLCDPPSSIATVFEGADNDNDGKKNCADADDDNDGICDEGGPVKPGDNCVEGASGRDDCPMSGATTFCFEAGQDCAEQWVDMCRGGGCNELFIKIWSVINPDPTRIVEVERFEIVNRTLYLFPTGGQVLSQLALGIVGDRGLGELAGVGAGLESARAGAQRAAGSGDRLRIELWSRRTNERVATVAEYDADDVAIGEVRRGSMLAVHIPAGATKAPQIVGTWVVGAMPQELPDKDADLIPDVSDNCLDTANVGQWDQNHDGFGDACDADLDDDGIVSKLDLRAIMRCNRADLRLPIPYNEPQDGRRKISKRPAVKSRNCEAADLDGNGKVNIRDVRIARQALGLPPGPSAKSASTER